MQMWSRGIPRRTNTRNILSLAHLLTCRHIDLLTVHIVCLQAIPVVDDDHIPRVAAVSGRSNCPIRGRVDRRPCGRGKVNPFVVGTGARQRLLSPAKRTGYPAVARTWMGEYAIAAHHRSACAVRVGSRFLPLLPLRRLHRFLQLRKLF